MVKKKKLVRSNKGTLAGICTGIAEYLELDPALIKFVFWCFLLATGMLPGIIAYLIGLAIIPKE
ncbi:MAG: PspC domain-containing protein [Candidatus Diapherotrites archaeon]|nr:PspC domain-containing protein [Candidatus Diapherotrites archaeon]